MGILLEARTEKSFKSGEMLTVFLFDGKITKPCLFDYFFRK